jgi:ABC-type polysaccharide/polyol phosphate transport system ATPase subunit
LLKILSRITEPTEGRAETSSRAWRGVHGRVGSLLDASRGTGSRSDPELTGRENIYLNGATLCVGMRRTEIEQVRRNRGLCRDAVLSEGEGSKSSWTRR